MIMEILAGIGACTAMLIAAELFWCLRDVFRNWRRNGCKIKLLCKPHEYEPERLWPNTGELFLKCKKCGKTKKIDIDAKSFKGWFDNL